MEVIDGRLANSSMGAMKVSIAGVTWVYKRKCVEAHALHEIAAFQVWKAVRPLCKGHWYVPLTIYAPDGGSLMQFVDEAATGRQVKHHHHDQSYIDDVTLAELQAFDYLIGNNDRHGENYLIDLAGRVVLIDHSLAFSEWFTTEWIGRSPAIKESKVDWRPAVPAIKAAMLVFGKNVRYAVLSKRVETLASKTLGEVTLT